MLDTLWSEFVEIKVGIGVGRPGDQTFTLDDAVLSQLDGVGTLGSADNPYDDRTCDVRALSWRQGATRTDGVLTRWEAGSATILLDNNDGKYDITAPNTRYQPMVKIRIWTRLAGEATWTPEWTGYADEWKMSWDETDETVTLTASDGTKMLTAYDTPELTTPVGDGDTAAQRAARILAEAQWPDGSRITAGGRVMQSTTMARDSWTQLLLNQDAELGATYIDRDGALVFRPRALGATATTKAVWGPSALRYEDAVVAIDDANYRNIVSAARVGGTEVTRRNDTEVVMRLPHTYGRNDLPFKLDTDVNDWCSVVLETGLDLTPRVDQLEVVPQIDGAALFPVVLGAQYLDEWQVTVDPPGKPTAITVLVLVRGWEHVVDREEWRTVFQLSHVLLFVPFQLDGGDNGDAQLDVMRLS